LSAGDAGAWAASWAERVEQPSRRAISVICARRVGCAFTRCRQLGEPGATKLGRQPGCGDGGTHDRRRRVQVGTDPLAAPTFGAAGAQPDVTVEQRGGRRARHHVMWSRRTCDCSFTACRAPGTAHTSAVSEGRRSCASGGRTCRATGRRRPDEQVDRQRQSTRPGRGDRRASPPRSTCGRRRGRTTGGANARGTGDRLDPRTRLYSAGPRL
jgi:hypothetical protein